MIWCARRSRFDASACLLTLDQRGLEVAMALAQFHSSGR
jgi:hypothetical protein